MAVYRSFLYVQQIVQHFDCPAQRSCFVFVIAERGPASLCDTLPEMIFAHPRLQKNGSLINPGNCLMELGNFQNHQNCYRPLNNSA